MRVKVLAQGNKESLLRASNSCLAGIHRDSRTCQPVSHACDPSYLQDQHSHDSIGHLFFYNYFLKVVHIQCIKRLDNTITVTLCNHCYLTEIFQDI